jgi:hypothetical protein
MKKESYGKWGDDYFWGRKHFGGALYFLWHVFLWHIVSWHIVWLEEFGFGGFW